MRSPSSTVLVQKSCRRDQKSKRLFNVHTASQETLSAPSSMTGGQRLARSDTPPRLLRPHRDDENILSYTENVRRNFLVSVDSVSILLVL